MTTVLIIMSIGIAVGFLISKRENLIKINDKLVRWAIYLLLFLLGIGVGTNKDIINNIHTIGLQAILITIAALLGSLICAYIVYRLFFKSKPTQDKSQQPST